MLSQLFADADAGQAARDRAMLDVQIAAFGRTLDDSGFQQYANNLDTRIKTLTPPRLVMPDFDVAYLAAARYGLV